MTNNVAKRNSDLKQDDKLKKVERALTTWLLTKSDKNFQQMHITNEMRCNEFSIQSLFLNGCTWKLRCKPQSRDNTSQSPRWTDGYLSEIFFPLAQFSETPWALLCPIQQSAVTAYLPALREHGLSCITKLYDARWCLLTFHNSAHIYLSRLVEFLELMTLFLYLDINGQESSYYAILAD